MKIKNLLLSTAIAGALLVPAIHSYADVSTGEAAEEYCNCPNNGTGHYGKGMRAQGKHGQHGRRGQGPKGPNPEMLKEKLALTEGQLPAWEAWKETVETMRKARKSHHEEMRERRQSGEKPDPLTAQSERLTHMEAHLEQMKVMNQAFEDFYLTLSEEQQETFKNLRPRRRRMGPPQDGDNSNESE